MLGIFDSGRGGQNVLAVLRRLAPRADIVFFADTLGAPYGTKGQEELLHRILRSESMLSRVGADRILIGCCTASILHSALPKNIQERLFPIVDATVEEAVRNCHGRIATLATEASAASGAFEKSIRQRDASLHAVSIPSQIFVRLAEEGKIHEEDAEFAHALDLTEDKLRASTSDTVILGCTHFHALAPYLKARLPNLSLISSAEAGARAFFNTLPEELTLGEGITMYL